MQLRAVGIDGISNQVLVGTALNVAQLEILVAFRQLIGVEDDLLGSLHRAALAAVDLVVQAFDRPRVAPPALVEGRRRVVGLLDPADDLAVQPIPELGGVCHGRVGVRVFGFQVGDHLWIFFVPKPVIGVDATVAVRLQDLWTLGDNRRPGRGDLHPPNSRVS